MLLTLVLSALLALCLAVYLYLTWNFNYWRRVGLATATPNTIFGTYPSIITRRRNMVFDIHDVYLKHKQQNRAVGVFVTRKPEILILDPKLAHDVLVTNFGQYKDTLTSSLIINPNEDKYVSRNPFWSAGAEWKARRTDGSAGLTQSRLKQSYPIWQASCSKLAGFLEERTTNVSCIIDSTDVMFCVYNQEHYITEETNKPNTIMEMCNRWTSHSFQTHTYAIMTTIAPVLRTLLPYRYFPKETDKFFAELTKNSVKLRLLKPDPERPDFLNHLLQLRELKQFSLDDMVGHALTGLLDGYETTGIVLAHTLYYLAKFPNVQEKLRKEILANVDAPPRDVSFETLTNLKFLDQCVHETLRLVTLLPNFSRICTEATTLVLSNEQSIRIPKGMVLTVPIYSFHHDEEYFPNPQSYIPERFDNGANVALTKQGVFLPFGDGPRICMGMRMALLSIKAALIAILSRYEVNSCPLTIDEGSTMKNSFILTLDGDIILEYKKLSV